jgi:hypothetical protein
VRAPGAETWVWVHINDLPETARHVILRRLSNPKDEGINTEVLAGIRRDMDSTDDS